MTTSIPIKGTPTDNFVKNYSNINNEISTPNVSTIRPDNKEQGFNQDLTTIDLIQVQAPKIFISGYQIDKSILLSYIPSMILFIVLWYVFKFNQTKCKLMTIFFWISIAIWLRNINAHRMEMLDHVNEEWTTMLQMRETVIIFLSVIMVFTMFLQNIKKDTTPYDYFVLVTIIFILCIGVFWYTTEDTSIMVRNVRNLYSACQNNAVLLFMAYILKTFICPSI